MKKSRTKIKVRTRGLRMILGPDPSLDLSLSPFPAHDLALKSRTKIKVRTKGLMDEKPVSLNT